MPYAMTPLPVQEHQRVSLNLCILLKEGLKNCKQCKVYPPIDWKIAEDTLVQPDALIVCDKIKKKYLDFPPVLVAEILSPSTAAKDRGIKMELYRMQGVKYYCLIDWRFKKIEIYELNNNSYQPVSVNPGSFEFIFNSCKANINFENIWE